MDLDIGQVRAFVVTAEHRHFSRAAEELFLTQQALSKRIRRLEEALSTRLFRRSNRAVELTADGERFLPHARELMRVADAAVASVGADDRPVRLDLLEGRLSPMFVLRKLAEADPELRVERSWRGGWSTRSSRYCAVRSTPRSAVCTASTAPARHCPPASTTGWSGWSRWSGCSRRSTRWQAVTPCA